MRTAPGRATMAPRLIARLFRRVIIALLAIARVLVVPKQGRGSGLILR
jgi:hypothetical protein